MIRLRAWAWRTLATPLWRAGHALLDAADACVRRANRWEARRTRGEGADA